MNVYAPPERGTFFRLEVSERAPFFRSLEVWARGLFSGKAFCERDTFSGKG